jgi:hypothetical protein
VLGRGKALMSTWHWPAVESLEDQCIVMVPVVDLRTIAREVSNLI